MSSFLKSIFKPSVDGLEKKKDCAGLAKVLEEGEPKARAQAVAALARIGGEEAAAGLSTALTDAEQDIRLKAVEALGAIGGEQAVTGLIAALKDADEGIRLKAIEALGKVGGERAVEPLIGMLHCLSFRVEDAARKAICQIRPSNFDPLLAALNHRNPDVRWSTALLLGMLGDSRAIEPLVALLDCPDKNLRDTAASSLGYLKDRRAVQPLIEMLKSEDTVYGAAMLLGELGDEAAVDPLIETLKNEKGRDNAIRSLGKLGEVSAVPPLIATAKAHPASSITYMLCLRALDALARDPVAREVVDEELGEPCELCGAKSAARRAVSVADLTTAIQKRRLPTTKMIDAASRWISHYSPSRAVNDWCYAMTGRTQPTLCCLTCAHIIWHWEEYPEQEFE